MTSPIRNKVPLDSQPTGFESTHNKEWDIIKFYDTYYGCIPIINGKQDFQNREIISVKLFDQLRLDYEKEMLEFFKSGKQSNIAFTEGNQRQIAYFLEQLRRDAVEENDKKWLEYNLHLTTEESKVVELKAKKELLDEIEEKFGVEPVTTDLVDIIAPYNEWNEFRAKTLGEQNK